jgi:hypothetical protein
VLPPRCCGFSHAIGLRFDPPGEKEIGQFIFSLTIKSCSHKIL